MHKFPAAFLKLQKKKRSDELTNQVKTTHVY